MFFLLFFPFISSTSRNLFATCSLGRNSPKQWLATENVEEDMFTWRFATCSNHQLSHFFWCVCRSVCRFAGYGPFQEQIAAWAKRNQHQIRIVVVSYWRWWWGSIVRSEVANLFNQLRTVCLWLKEQKGTQFLHSTELFLLNKEGISSWFFYELQIVARVTINNNVP